MPLGNYYFSTTARNDVAGRASLRSTPYSWSANLQANSVTYTNMAPNGTGMIYSGGFDVNNGTSWENAQARTNYSAPIYIDGSTVTQPTSTEIWPYGQGTRTTAQGFPVNSIGPYDPLGGADQKINEGDYGWYILSYVDFTTDPLDTNEFMLGYMNMTVNTYVNNTHIQICPWIINSATPAGKISLQTQFQFDVILPMIGPADSFRTSIDRNFALTGSSTIYYYGYAVRVLTTSAVPYFDQFEIILKQNKIS